MTQAFNRRMLTGHIVNPANDMLSVIVADEPGSGGANHRYEISGMSLGANAGSGKAHMRWNMAKEYFAGNSRNTELTMHYRHVLDKKDDLVLLFQNGPIAESGVNGITHEVLLAVLIDRLEGFQAGPYASADNAEALDSLRNAQAALQRRTLERMNRGVEGTHQV